MWFSIAQTVVVRCMIVINTTLVTTVLLRLWLIKPPTLRTVTKSQCPLTWLHLSRHKKCGSLVSVTPFQSLLLNPSFYWSSSVPFSLWIIISNSVWDTFDLIFAQTTKVAFPSEQLFAEMHTVWKRLWELAMSVNVLSFVTGNRHNTSHQLRLLLLCVSWQTWQVWSPLTGILF